MSDKINAITIVLENDVHEEYADAIIDSIKLIRGVLSAKNHVVDINSLIAEERAKDKILNKFGKLLIELRRE